MGEMLRLMLVDDQPIMRKGLRNIIDERKDMEVVGEAGSMEEALQVCQATQPHLAVLDSLCDGSGPEFIAEAKKLVPHLKVLVFTNNDEARYLHQVLAADGNGYILKRATELELILAIQAVARGEMYIDSFMTKGLLRDVNDKEMDKKEAFNLSGRQKEILRMVALGFTDRQIAEKLFISIKTVESNKARIKEKLNMSERSELVQYALDKFF